MIPALRQDSPYFDMQAVRTRMEDAGVETSPTTLKVYLSQFMADGLIHSAGKGWYSGIPEAFVLDTAPVAELVGELKGAFPLLDFSCWSTQQINSFAHHVLAKFVTFVHVDRDAASGVFNVLRDADYNVFLNPTKREADKNFEVRGKTVVIRPAIVKSPVERHFAKIEKVLVDLCVEIEVLPLMSGSEFREMFENLIRSARISMAELLSYAKRRKVSREELLP